MSLSTSQQNKLEKIKKLLDSGNVGIITYLMSLEDRLDNDLPQIIDVISRLKGDKGDAYELTNSDKKEIAKYSRELLNDEEIARTVLSLIDIPLDEIAREASKLIKVPQAEKVDYKKIKKEVIAEIILPDVQNGKDADETVIAEKVTSTLEKNLPSFGEAFRDGLELLQGDDRLNITAIKGIEDYEEVSKLAKASQFLNRGGNGKGLLSQQNDVTITNPTNNQVLKYNSTTSKWENGTGGGGSSPLTTKGDLYGYNTSNARIPVGDNGTVLTADSSNALGVSWQPPQTGGVFTYYWTPTASDVASQYKQLDTPYATISTFTTTAATDGQLLRTYVTEPNQPGLSFIPAGQYKTHIHANVATISGKKDTYLRAEIWEVDASGTDIVKIANVGPTVILTATSAEYIIEYSTVQINLASTTSRIATKLYATVSGTGGQPDITISVGDGTDSNTIFPAATVSVNNFVPYTGATKDVNLGTNGITVNDMTLAGTNPWNLVQGTDALGTANAFLIRNGSTTVFSSTPAGDILFTGTSPFIGVSDRSGGISRAMGFYANINTSNIWSSFLSQNILSIGTDNGRITLGRTAYNYDGNGAVSSKVTILGEGATSATSALNVLNSSSSSLLFVRDDGNVGIGTTNPDTKLNVVSDTYPVFRTTRTTTGTANILAAGTFKAQTTGNMVDGFGIFNTFEIQDSAGVANAIGNIGAVRDGSDNSGSLSFLTYNAGIQSEKMRIKPDGNVGIGTTLPEHRLHVLADQSGGMALFERSTTVTNVVAGTVKVKATSTGNMADGFGTAFQFYIEDNANIENLAGDIRAVRNGADNTSYVSIFTTTGGTNAERLRVTDIRTIVSAPFNLAGYTVATLPTGVQGDITYVTDQLTTAAAKGVAPTGGGSVKCVVFHNGTSWVGI